MNQHSLGKLEQVGLREVWPHEAQDFTKWLSKEANIALLQEELDLTFEDVKIEDPTGRYTVDMTAQDSEGRKVIIENQLDSTDHKHLGQLLTYASGFDASIIIWIVQDYREEHKQAVDWFNRHMPEAISFFLIKLELWKIQDSPPAPKFNVVAQPNEWSKIVNQSTQENQLTDTKLLQQEFWESFKEFVNKNNGSLKVSRKARPRPFYKVSIGTSLAHLSLTINFRKELIGCEIFIKSSEEQFENLRNHRNEIESELGYQVDFQDLKGKIGFRVMVQNDINPKKRENWEECFQWLMEKTRDFKQVFPPYFS